MVWKMGNKLIKITGRRLVIFFIGIILILGATLFFQYRSDDIFFLYPGYNGVKVIKTDFYSDDVKLEGSLIGPDDNDVHPGIVVIHGTSPAGMDTTLYKILTYELAKKGYMVLIYNQRGYGTSQDPPVNKNNEYILNFAGDALNAIKHLHSFKRVKKDRILVIGHSFGATVAIGLAHEPDIDKKVKEIVLISPGTGWPYKGDERYNYRSWRLSKDMELKPVIGLNVLKKLYRTMELGSLMNRVDSVPIKLIVSSDEEQDKYKDIKGFIKQVPPPARLKVINGTKHYFGTRKKINRLYLPIKIYEKNKMSRLIEAILD